ncbi:MAG TPA: LuxR C-terminal-related transcriptional regulator, partial [Ktedonobacteraceae bacterium]|nr:LuxR C-terminal-related transcriptional regulator [Ktedonobacteraceae bacterium]
RALLQATPPVAARRNEDAVNLSPRLMDSLTPQEQRVLRLLARGASNQEIAETLVISLSAVKKHVSHLLSKLEAENRTQAIVRARSLHLLDEEYD